jgi:hypothetical protein
LEIHAAIFGLTTVQAADHVRSREALEGALGPRQARLAPKASSADKANRVSDLAHEPVDGDLAHASCGFGVLVLLDEVGSCRDRTFGFGIVRC